MRNPPATPCPRRAAVNRDLAPDNASTMHRTIPFENTIDAD